MELLGGRNVIQMWAFSLLRKVVVPVDHIQAADYHFLILPPNNKAFYLKLSPCL